MYNRAGGKEGTDRKRKTDYQGKHIGGQTLGPSRVSSPSPESSSLLSDHNQAQLHLNWKKTSWGRPRNKGKQKKVKKQETKSSDSLFLALADVMAELVGVVVWCGVGRSPGHHLPVYRSFQQERWN